MIPLPLAEQNSAALPSYVQIEPVGQCNLRCQMCPIQFRQDGPPYGPPAYMPFDTYTRLIDQFENLKDLHLQGLGEPTMHPRFFDMVRYAVDRGIKVSINTNMTLLNPRRMERLIDSGLETIHISIDGATRRTFEFIRTQARLKTVLRNAVALRDAKKRLHSSLPHTRMVAVAMRMNLEEFPELVRLAHRLEMESLFIQHLCHDFGESSLPTHYRPMRDFVEKQTLLEEDLGRIIYYFEKAREMARELGVDLRLPHTRKKIHPAGTPGPERCNWPWTGAYVSYQGLAMPCCMVATPDRINFGSMGTEGVKTIWNNDAFRTFRGQLDSDDPPEICKSCSVYSGTF